MKKRRDILTIAIFLLIIFGLGIAFFVMPDIANSRTERRLMARPPVVSAGGILSGQTMTDLEPYMQDQFPARELFRTINAMTRRYALGQRDHNGYFLAGGHLSQMEHPLNDAAAIENARWLAGMSHNLFQGMNVFYAIIPDKNYFLAPSHGFLHLDYYEFMEIIHRYMGSHNYIDLFEIMSLDDFYRTDIHWRQEALHPIAEHIANAMGATLPPADSFTSHTLPNFRGNFHGAAALPVRADELVFLTNQYTENAIVHTLMEQNREFVFSRYVTFQGEELRLGVYNPRLFEGLDGYDMFLAGAQAIITVYAPNAATDRELIIFRDSFGSSIAPLFLGGYSKITLVDIRYISSHLLSNFIDFNDQDILFLYSVPILNRGGLFR
ncbi:MAG: hypothetical protein FWE44_01575 [Defluviitaleaceae bacterium]|nr:hypothetical protein [Defluviitaleaceae bacterium]